MALPPLPLGPFDLLEIAGAGGMGTVWRAVHRDQRVPVAVKIATGPDAHLPEYVREFQREARAMAGLHHPAIITILDYGRIPPEAERASQGRLVTGSPYLAMEYASGGTLDTLATPMSWPVLRGVLLAILDALAHAHARGVIHRDLKPGNVLIATADDGRPGLRLTDFGLAKLLGAHTQNDSMAGTPAYMSPEQLSERDHDLGPWTDLYALGVTAYLLATGRLPFRGRTFFMLAQEHLKSPPPPMHLGADFPEGFEPWVRRLLEKQPAQRFRRAADAAWALSRLESTPRQPLLPGPTTSPLAWERIQELIQRDQAPRRADLPDLGDSPVLAWIELPGSAAAAPLRWNVEVSTDAPAPPNFDDDVAFRPTHLGIPSIVSVIRPDGSVDFVPAEDEQPDYDEHLPPFPDTWRLPSPPQRSLRLIGAGLGLFGLRRVELVGREEERTALWSLLADVRRARAARLAVLRGPAGLGKTALAEWIACRAHEVGTATVLRVQHTPQDGPTDALQRLLAEALGVERAAPAEVRPRVTERLRELDPHVDQVEIDALTEIVLPAAPLLGATSTALRVTTPATRYALLRRLLLRLAAERPVILWLDSVEWGSDTLALVEHLLAPHRREGAALLILVTANDERLAARPFERRQLDQLASLAESRAWTLPPLDPAQLTALVQRLLDLEAAHAAHLVARAEGNPLFAIQLLADWVARDALAVSPAGFTLREGLSAALPDDLHALWMRRLEPLLRAARPDTRRALQAAAALGAHVNLHEWTRVCHDMRLDISVDITDALALQGLVVLDGAGWAFASGMLRESLERSAREDDAWLTLHAACARVLNTLYGAGHRAAARIGAHWSHAERFEEALHPLLIAMEDRHRAGAFSDALHLYDLRLAALQRLDAAPDDPRRLVGDLLLVRLLLKQSRVNEAARHLDALRPHLRPDHSAAWADACWAEGTLAHLRGDPERARALLDEAAALYAAAGDQPGLARALQSQGECFKRRGDLTPAVLAYQRALEIFTAQGDLGSVGRTLLSAADAYRRAGDLASCEALLKRALDILNELKDQSSLSAAWGLLGDVARYRGDLDDAEQRYLHALGLAQLIDSPDTGTQRVNLGLVFLQRGALQQALWMLEAGLDELTQAGHLAALGVVHALLLPAHAAAADWPLWDLHYNEAEAAIQEAALADPDVAWAAEWAGRLAAERGAASRARRALELARRQYEALGDRGGAERVTDALAAP